MKKYVNNSFINKSPSEYKNGTAAVTNLPVTIYTDGQPVSSYTIKGNTQTSGTPSPQNPVTISGVGNETANLFNIATATIGYYINSAGVETQSSNGTASHSDYIEIEPDASYTFAEIRKEYYGATFACAWYDSSKNFISRDSFAEPTTSGRVEYTYTAPSTATYAIFNFMKYPDYSSEYVMINKGSTALPYEPYGYKISILKDLQALTPMYLTEPLLKIGDYEDTLNSDGTVTRRIGKIDLGTRTYSKTSSGNFYFSSALSNVRIITNLQKNNGLCTNFFEVEPQAYASTPYSFCTCINSSAVACFNGTGFEGYTTEQFKEAMSGVYMYYVHATPTTESVTAPTITTTGGEVTLDVDTTVKPSELDLTYHGWHEHEPLKRENGAWV